MSSQNFDLNKERSDRKRKELDTLLAAIQNKEFDINMRLDYKYVKAYAECKGLKMSRLQKTIERAVVLLKSLHSARKNFIAKKANKIAEDRKNNAKISQS